MTETKHNEVSIQDALKDWRAAEQAAAVARRGKLAAETAAAAAEDAAVAAVATSKAANAALKAAAKAEKSAAQTARSARAAALASKGDLSDAITDAQQAEIEELAAADRYRVAVRSRDGR
jgi:hypothetical protein